MRVLDLFSGIGGFSLGLERAGMKTVAFCEYDDKCRQVLKNHWPDVPIFNDVSNLSADTYGNLWDKTKYRGIEEPAADHIDVICGGFP